MPRGLERGGEALALADLVASRRATAAAMARLPIEAAATSMAFTGAGRPASSADSVRASWLVAYMRMRRAEVGDAQQRAVARSPPSPRGAAR